MKKIKRETIICLTDGYHDPHYYFQFGDDKYGDFALNKELAKRGLKRMFLHAWRMRFLHPLTHEPQAFEAPLPEALVSFLNRLSKEETKDYEQTV